MNGQISQQKIVSDLSSTPVLYICCKLKCYLMLCPLDGLDVDAVLEHLPQRRHLPQPLHLPHRPRDRVVHLLLRREPPDAESEEERISNLMLVHDFQRQMWLMGTA